MSTATDNKVKFNIHDVHYALPASSGTSTWQTPKALPGAVSLSLDPQGELYQFYADGVEYYRCRTNSGYDGDLEIAHIPDDFLVDVLKETLHTTAKTLLEKTGVEDQKFALGFDIDGDQKTTRFWFYNCYASRPKIEAKTSETSREVQTDTLTINFRPDASGNVRCKTTVDTPAETFSGWYTQVYVQGD